MCLRFELSPHVANRVGPRRLEEAAGVPAKKTAGVLTFGADCACILLGERDERWPKVVSLNTTLIDGLVSAFKLVAKEADGFVLDVLASDYDEVFEIEGERRLPIKEFIALLQANSLENAKRYVVG